MHTYACIKTQLIYCIDHVLYIFRHAHFPPSNMADGWIRQAAAVGRSMYVFLWLGLLLVLVQQHDRPHLSMTMMNY